MAKQAAAKPATKKSTTGGRTSTTEAILGVLSQGPMTGYEVFKYMEGSTESFWSESFGQLYPTLKKMSDDGLIELWEKKSKADADEASGHPSRKAYKLTTAGTKRLQKWLAAPARPRSPRNETLLRLFFAMSALPGEMATQVEAYRDRAQVDLTRYEALLRAMNKEFGAKSGSVEHPGLPYWQMTLRHGIAEAKMMLKWSEATLLDLKKADDAYRKRGR